MIVVFGSLVVDMLNRVERFPRPGETVLCPDYQLDTRINLHILHPGAGDGVFGWFFSGF